MAALVEACLRRDVRRSVRERAATRGPLIERQWDRERAWLIQRDDCNGDVCYYVAEHQVRADGPIGWPFIG